ncbi:VOC family protein [Natronolimnohabitans innermongolicus]|uniref:Glyoxalase/bleomycin resistance protein/dioxygenase n=1 Tax=Natronolimnohabitans innermongolicus JCM 12255 TaxID=1227499 RepID=L9XAF3_9EURY|nr:VOC family protein [Natronolimnohabitans innermongolicus]ELY57578.1 glyoxalase/bleomycin resistance protein/dioxygenase [Natronolimnohabitans innermongolicus JCM 12255]
MTPLSAHHVGITVNDLEETLPFYRDVLGLEVVDRFSVGGEAFSDAVGVDDATGTFAHLEADGIRLELVEYEPEARGSPAAGLNQPGASHVGLAVDDLEAFYAALPADVQTISEPRTTESGTSILFLRDPESNLIEVLEA